MEQKKDPLTKTRDDLQKILATADKGRLWRWNVTCALCIVKGMTKIRDFAELSRQVMDDIRAENRGYKPHDWER